MRNRGVEQILKRSHKPIPATHLPARTIDPMNTREKLLALTHETIKESSDRIAHYQQLLEIERATRDGAIYRAIKQGTPARKIARSIGISHQAILDIVKKQDKAKNEIPEPCGTQHLGNFTCNLPAGHEPPHEDTNAKTSWLTEEERQKAGEQYRAELSEMLDRVAGEAP